MPEEASGVFLGDRAGLPGDYAKGRSAYALGFIGGLTIAVVPPVSLGVTALRTPDGWGVGVGVGVRRR